MKKLWFIKFITIFMGICIILSMIFISISLFTRNKKETKDLSEAKTIHKIIISESNIKKFQVNNNKIYMQLSSSKGDELLMIEEKSGNILLHIEVKKGENNGR